MPEQFEQITIQLTNQKVQFAGESAANPNHPIAFDYKPPIGDGQGYNGLELLLMSFGGCSATAMVYLLRKMGKTVSGFELKAKGLRSQQPPIKFEKIFLEFVLHSNNARQEDVEKAIKMAEETACPVWQMIKGNVEVATEYKIIG